MPAEGAGSLYHRTDIGIPRTTAPRAPSPQERAEELLAVAPGARRAGILAAEAARMSEIKRDAEIIQFSAAANVLLSAYHLTSEDLEEFIFRGVPKREQGSCRRY
jgi:hypothetical protein